MRRTQLLNCPAPPCSRHQTKPIGATSVAGLYARRPTQAYSLLNTLLWPFAGESLRRLSLGSPALPVLTRRFFASTAWMASSALFLWNSCGQWRHGCGMGAAWAAWACRVRQSSANLSTSCHASHVRETSHVAVERHLPSRAIASTCHVPSYLPAIKATGQEVGWLA